MASSNPQKNDRVKFYQNPNFYLAVVASFATCFVLYIIYRAHKSERNVISFSVVAIFLGIIYENRKLSSTWKMIGLKALGALMLSFFVFMPGKRSHNYDFTRNIEIWPFVFIGFFVLASVIFHQRKIVPQITEGIAFIQ